MICSLCLEHLIDSKNCFQINALMQGEEELQIKQLVEMNFLFIKWNESSDSDVLCSTCLEVISSFNKFLRRIKQSHEMLKDAAANLIEPAIELSNVKIESDGPSENTTPEKRKRGRPPKRKTKQRTEIEDLDVKKIFVEELKMSVKEELTPSVVVISDDVTAQVDNKDEIVDEIQRGDAVVMKDDEVKQDNSNFFLENDDFMDGSDSEDNGKTQNSTKTNSKAHNHSYKKNQSRQFDEFIAENYKLSCSLCQIPLSDFTTLKRHYRQQHRVRGYVTCCGKKLIKRGVLVDHIHWHKDPMHFKCHNCERAFADRRGLELHERRKHEKDRERKYQCGICSKKFFNRSVFVRHELLHVPEEEKKIPCPQCEKTFAKNNIMVQHLSRVHLKLYAKICEICGKSITGRDALKKHQDEHAGILPPPIHCELCGLSVSTKYALKRHMKLRHSSKYQEPQKCPICSKLSPNLVAQQRHIQYMHTMERKHACQLCDKAFKRRQDLKEHMSTHTGCVLYTCPHCPKTFNSNANMHSHRKKMHRKEWEEKRLQRYKETHKMSC